MEILVRKLVAADNALREKVRQSKYALKKIILWHLDITDYDKFSVYTKNSEGKMVRALMYELEAQLDIVGMVSTGVFKTHGEYLDRCHGLKTAGSDCSIYFEYLAEIEALNAKIESIYSDMRGTINRDDYLEAKAKKVGKIPLVK